MPEPPPPPPPPTTNDGITLLASSPLSNSPATTSSTPPSQAQGAEAGTGDTEGALHEERDRVEDFSFESQPSSSSASASTPVAGGPIDYAAIDAAIALS